jgi:hypothetical protein
MILEKFITLFPFLLLFTLSFCWLFLYLLLRLRRLQEARHNNFKLVKPNRISKLWFAQNPNHTGHLKLAQLWKTNLVAPSQEIICGHHFNIYLTFKLIEYMDHLFTPVSVDHRSLNLLETLGNSVEDLLSLVKHLFLRDLDLLLLVLLTGVHWLIWYFISLLCVLIIILVRLACFHLGRNMLLWFNQLLRYIVLYILFIVRLVFRVGVLLQKLFLGCDSFNFDRFGWRRNFFIFLLNWSLFLNDLDLLGSR